MTFSLAIGPRTPNGWFHTISDVLITTKNSSGRKILLPHMISEQILQFGNSHPYEIDQKTVIFGRTLFQYSGNVRSCKQVLDKYRYRSNNGEEFYPLSEAVKECNLTKEDDESTLIATHFISQKFEMQSSKYRFIEGLITTGDEEYFFLTEGTGAKHFLEGLIDDSKYEEPRAIQLRLLDRITEVTVEPFFQENASLAKKYGSWFELVLLTPSGFKKLPSAIQFWFRRNHSAQYEPGPLTFSQYLDHDLLIHTMFPLADGSSHHNMLRARDPLRRGQAVLNQKNANMGEIVDFSPHLLTHFLVDATTGRTRFIQLERASLTSPINGGIRLGTDRGSGGTEFRPEYDAAAIDLVNSQT